MPSGLWLAGVWAAVSGCQCGPTAELRKAATPLAAATVITWVWGDCWDADRAHVFGNRGSDTEGAADLEVDQDVIEGVTVEAINGARIWRGGEARARLALERGLRFRVRSNQRGWFEVEVLELRPTCPPAKTILTQVRAERLSAGSRASPRPP